MDNNIRKEQEFMTLLQKTLKQARDNGGLITRDEIMENFASVSLEESQLAQVEEYLRTNKIVKKKEIFSVPIWKSLTLYPGSQTPSWTR